MWVVGMCRVGHSRINSMPNHRAIVSLAPDHSCKWNSQYPARFREREVRNRIVVVKDVYNCSVKDTWVFKGTGYKYVFLAVQR